MDVLKIAICDDTVEECREVEACAARFFGDRRLKARIDTYKDMPELLAADEEYDLYLLDVLMPGMTGIEGAGALQKKVERPVVVFITSSLESAVDGYSVNAAGFVLKPVEPERLEATLERVLRKLEKVVYFENRLHRVYVALDDGELLTISHKLSELQEELEGFSQFLRCHQSYIVNLDHVEALEESCFQMAGGQVVPVSRNFYKQSKYAYYHHRLK